MGATSPRSLRIAYALVTLALMLRVPPQTKVFKAAAPPCWSRPNDEHGDLDPCAHCGHLTDALCAACAEKGAPKRDVCPCCREAHWNAVHVAGGRAQ